MLTWVQYIRQQGQFRCQDSAAHAGTSTVQFVVNNQVEAEFAGLTVQQLQQLETAIHAHLNPPAGGGGAAPNAAGT